MPQDYDLSILYRSAINLWVEDSLTKEYLEIAWNSPPEITIRIAGGSGGVRTILEDVRKSGYPHVFGAIDGDFRPSNMTKWITPTDPFSPLILPVSEIENYLLDPDALAGCVCNNMERTSGWIAQTMQKRAADLTWWKACKQVLDFLSNLFRSDFPEAPKCPAITTQAEAESHILDHPKAWAKTLAARTNQADETSIRERLTEAKKQADEQIANQQWKTQFPGKEIFRPILSLIYDCKDHKTSKGERDIDVAKAVARWQSENKKIPTDITALLAALRHRVGISPAI